MNVVSAYYCRKMERNKRRKMVVIGGCAAVSLKFHIVHTYDCHRTKGKPWNSLMKAGTKKK